MRLAVDQRHPDVDHRVAGQHAPLHLGADALLHRRDELVRHRRRRRSCRRTRSPSRTAAARPRCRRSPNSPWPPDCLTFRPRPLGLGREGLAQRHPQRPGLHRHAVPAAQPVEQHVRRAPRPCTTGPAGGSRRCSPGAASGPRRPAGPGPATACPRRPCDLAVIATGSSGSGISHGSISSGWSLSDSVSPVSALASLATAQMSPAIALRSTRALLLAERRGQRADPLVHVVVRVARGRPGRGRTRARRRPAAGCRRTPGPG